ncbi:MAG TPA: DUF885 domain-containing protein [Candidatus Binatia bacterium]|nr:DUF885 domain-containing protein [Candidatus Binatia bacterium]
MIRTLHHSLFGRHRKKFRPLIKPQRWLLLLGVVTLGCTADTRLGARQSSSHSSTASQQVRETLEDYFDEFLKLAPLFATSVGDHRYDDQLGIVISAEQRERRRALYQRYQGRIATISSERLEADDRLILAVFERTLTRNLEALQFKQHLQPVRQLNSMPVNFPVIGSGTGLHPFKAVTDYDNFLKRIDRFSIWVDTAIANMRQGVAVGVVQPRVVIEKTLPQLDAMIVADPKQSLFFQPILRMPQHFSESEKARLTANYLRAIEQRIVPAYRKLRSFIQEEYLPKTRSTYGLSNLPDGIAWYEHAVRSRTTTTLTPEEIYQLGTEEIQRIKKEMERMRSASGFPGDLREFSRYLAKTAPPGFSNRDDLVKGYEAIRLKVTPRLPRIFGHLPKATFEIRTVEQFREKSSPSQYQPGSPDGSRPGIFYVNASGIERNPRRASESLFLHEAVPGHHFQISLQREQERLPRFRRFGNYTAFAEGWALYAESLGPELGLYNEPSQYFRRLNSELFRAARLVVDVGLHRKNWSRDQALQFMRETTGASEAGASLEIDRYIAWPAQALSYKIGQLKISAIRSKAEKTLGSKFDIRVFHGELLKDGAMQLDLLERKMDVWIENQQH